MEIETEPLNPNPDPPTRVKGRKGSKRRADGNMETPPASTDNTEKDRKNVKRQKRQIEGRNYFFTWNNYTEENITQLLTWLRGRKAKYVFQEEKGHDTGTPHLQGHICFSSSVPKTLVDKIIPWSEFTKNVKAATAYCTKLDSRNGKIYSEGFKIPELLIDELEGLDPYEFQQFILDLYYEPRHPRRVHWLWNQDGDVGKTSLLKSMVSRGMNVCYVGNSTKHAAQTLGTHIAKMGYPKMVFINLPRGGDANYQLIEKIKDGCIHCDMYDTGTVMFNRPHVVVFANMEPGDLVNGRIVPYEITSDGKMIKS